MNNKPNSLDPKTAFTSHPDFPKLLDVIAISGYSPGKVAELIAEALQKEFALSYVFSKVVKSDPSFLVSHAQAKAALDSFIHSPVAFDPRDRIEPTWKVPLKEQEIKRS